MGSEFEFEKGLKFFTKACHKHKWFFKTYKGKATTQEEMSI